MSAAALEDALSALGLHCHVEARERLAVLVRREGAAAGDAADVLEALADAATRRRIMTLAADHGFTHLALELDDEPQRIAGGAPFPRD